MPRHNFFFFYRFLKIFIVQFIKQNMKKWLIWMLIILGILVFIILAFFLSSPKIGGHASEKDYSCHIKSDCVSTCAWKCVNKGFANSHADLCNNIMAHNCDCINNACYSDGYPPRYLRDNSS